MAGASLHVWGNSAGADYRSSSTLPSSAIPGSSADDRTFTTTQTTDADGYAPTSASAQDPHAPQERTPYFPQVNVT